MCTLRYPYRGSAENLLFGYLFSRLVLPVFHVLVGGIVATIRYIPLRCFCKNVVLEQIFESTEVVYIPLTAYVNTLYRFETGKIYGYYAVWTKSRERACY